MDWQAVKHFVGTTEFIVGSLGASLLMSLLSAVLYKIIDTRWQRRSERARLKAAERSQKSELRIAAMVADPFVLLIGAAWEMKLRIMHVHLNVVVLFFFIMVVAIEDVGWIFAGLMTGVMVLAATGTAVYWLAEQREAEIAEAVRRRGGQLAAEKGKSQ